MKKLEYDIYRINSENLPVSFRSNRLDIIEGRTASRSVCRVIDDGRIGYFTSQNTMSDEELIKQAGKTAKFGKKTDIVLPDSDKIKDIDVYSEEVKSLKTEEMVEWGYEIIEGVKEGLGRDFPIDISVEKEIEEYSLINSRGVDYHHRLSSIALSAILTDAGEKDIHLVFDFDFSWSAEEIDCEMVIESIIENYRQGQKTTSVESGKMPVIIHPYAVFQFLLPLLAGINGRFIKDGTSPLCGKIGEKIFNENITIYDNPFLEDSPASAGFDKEGVPARKRTIVDKGILKSFNHTLETARETGDEPTGGALRGGDGKAYPGVFNLVIENGEHSYKDLLNEIDDGLLLRFMSGSGQSNTLAGEYSMGVYSGFKLNDGDYDGRVKQIMVAGNIYDDFKRAIGVSKEGDYFFYDNVILHLPYILVDGISVSGI
jgi:PmbA protein